MPTRGPCRGKGFLGRLGVVSWGGGRDVSKLQYIVPKRLLENPPGVKDSLPGPNLPPLSHHLRPQALGEQGYHTCLNLLVCA